MKKLIAIAILLLCCSSLFAFPIFIEGDLPEPQEGDELFVEASDEITYGSLRRAIWYKDMYGLAIEFTISTHELGTLLEDELRSQKLFKEIFIVTTITVTVVALIEGVLLYVREKD